MTSLHKITALLIFMLIACNGEPDFVLDDRLLPYFELFSEEAAKRGIIFNNDIEQIQGLITTINRPNSTDILGFCEPIAFRRPFRSISVDIYFWSNSTSLEKEYLVFHELGHCFLNRDHVIPPVIDSLGRCLSIMNAGNAPCSSLESYTLERRDFLLDELFEN